MVSSISNSENYENRFYVPRSRSEKETGFLLASAASALVMGALPYFSKPFQKQIIKEHLNNDLYKDAFVKSVDLSGLRNKGLDFINITNSTVYKDIAEGLNACYVPNTKTILLNTEKASITGFHELGHAMNHLDSKFGKFLQKCRKPGYSIAALMGSIAFISRNKPKDADKDFKDFILDNSGKIAVIGIMPTIIEEAMASYKGVKIAQKAGLAEPLIKNLKNIYKKAFMSYAGYGILAGLSVYATSKIIEKYTRPKEIRW